MQASAQQICHLHWESFRIRCYRVKCQTWCIGAILSADHASNHSAIKGRGGGVESWVWSCSKLSAGNLFVFCIKKFVPKVETRVVHIVVSHCQRSPPASLPSPPLHLSLSPSRICLCVHLLPSHCLLSQFDCTCFAHVVANLFVMLTDGSPK